MSRTATPVREAAPDPERGDRVLLAGLPGGPWSSVIGSREERRVTLDPPRLGGSVVRLPIGRAFVVSYSRREVPCEIDAELTGGPAADGSGPYVARLVGEGRRIQRRSAVRVPARLVARAVVAEGIDDAGAPVTLGAITENLSAGGALMRLDRPLAVGTPIAMTIDCGGEVGILDASARVVRCDLLEPDGKVFHVAVAFLGLSGCDEDRLVRLVFDWQRRVRRDVAGS